jgi:hypothetical protein
MTMMTMTSVTFHTKLKLRVWRPMPAEPPGIVPGQDEEAHWAAVRVIYRALVWIGNPSLVPKIVAGDMKPMADRLHDSIKRTGETR